MKPSNSAPTKPWNARETVGLTILILVVFFSISSAIALFFVILQMVQDPSLTPEAVLAEIEKDGLVLSLATLISGIVTSGMIYALLKVRPALTVKQYLALRKPRWTAWFIWNGLLLALILLSESILRSFEYQDTFTAELYQTAQFPILLYIAIVGIAPVFEELLFRGFLFHGLQSSRLGSGGAIVITAVGWAILHVQYGPLVISQIVCFGLLFGVARWQTHSLFVPLSMHCLNNFLALLTTSLQHP
ncbi:CPBP family intramembrane glutamic endopeptidase [Acaryochloris marina]|uniref:CPBP family intramembrane glutamic endopeptidase n=1 Tax=Acaryochloris marina TaxID=155978 RepID=UPI001BB00C84|nr:CPBP family intramembrane glutamic endopeptidase [Acaryochloris marina]QUY42388.1 CPBP family intramembrane metalloprotease [Acaryochloris marina S15]